MFRARCINLPAVFNHLPKHPLFIICLICPILIFSWSGEHELPYPPCMVHGQPPLTCSKRTGKACGISSTDDPFSNKLCIITSKELISVQGLHEGLHEGVPQRSPRRYELVQTCQQWRETNAHLTPSPWAKFRDFLPTLITPQFHFRGKKAVIARRTRQTASEHALPRSHLCSITRHASSMQEDVLLVFRSFSRRMNHREIAP